MKKEIFHLKFINVKNNFLHLSPNSYNNFASSSVCALKVEHYKKICYFSLGPSPFTGGLEDDEIGINAPYARDLGLVENAITVVSPIYNIGSIKRLNVSPATEDDYTIVYSSSESIESNLLNQLRIVWPGQIFTAWISNNICVKLIADSITPQIPFGRLEEYTEIIVGDAKNNNNNKDVYKNSNVIMPDYVRFFSKKETQALSTVLIFRSVPIKTEFNDRSKEYCHPFVVYAFKENVPECVIKHTEEPSTVFRFKVLQLEEDEEQPKILHVHLEFIERNHKFISGIDTAGFKSLFVTESVQNHFNLEVGTKVILECVKTEGNPKEIVGLLVTPIISEQVDEKELKKDVYNKLFHSILNHGNLLLNTKAEFPLDRRKRAILTLRPLDIEWGFLNISSLKSISISINEFSSVDVSTDDEVPEEFNCKFESMTKLDCETKLTSILSLNLNEYQMKKCNFYDNLLVTGKTGTGKSTFVDLFLKSLSDPPYYVSSEKIDCCILKGKRVETVTKYLLDKLHRCRRQQPSVIFFDNISSLNSKPKSDQPENMETTLHYDRVALKILELVENYQKDNAIWVIGTATSLADVNKNLFSPRGRSLFTSQLAIPELTKNDRYTFIKELITSKKYCSHVDEDGLNKIANETDGFMIFDLVKLIKKAAFEAWQRQAEIGGYLQMSYFDLELSLNCTKPSSLHGINLNEKIDCDLSHVGGLSETKDKIVEVLLWPCLYPEIMKQCPLKTQNAVLLYGAPGSGKTLLANAIAGESKLNFISVKGPELMSKYIGQSEEGVRNIFEKAQTAKPCLLFFDEFDSLAPRRGKDQTGVTDRVVNQLLTALDGVEPLTGVSIIAATSRPDLIDPALLRPGRIGVSVLCRFPDQDERLEILKVLSKNVYLSENVNLEEIAKLTEGFSGADLKGIYTTAQIKLIDKYVSESFEEVTECLVPAALENKTNLKIEHNHLVAAVEETIPSLNDKERRKYERIYAEFRNPSKVDVSAQKTTFA